MLVSEKNIGQNHVRGMHCAANGINLRRINIDIKESRT